MSLVDEARVQAEERKRRRKFLAGRTLEILRGMKPGEVTALSTADAYRLAAAEFEHDSTPDRVPDTGSGDDH